MSLLRKALLVFSLIAIGLSDVYANQSQQTSFSLLHENPILFAQESTCLINLKEGMESIGQQYSPSDSSVKEAYPLLFAIPTFSKDSSSCLEVLKYLKKVTPTYSRINDSDVEMIEIL